MTIRTMKPGEGAEVVAAGHLFDATPDLATAEHFLVTPGHHLLIAYRMGRRRGSSVAWS